MSLHQKGQLAQAKAIYEQVLESQPQDFDAMHLLGVIFRQTGELALAEELIAKAIEINPNSASAYSNRGNALKDLKRLDEALASYDRAIALKPDFADALYNRGDALTDLQRLDEALASYDCAITHKLNNPDVFYSRGMALHGLKRLDEALASYDRAIALKPDAPNVFYRRGVTLHGLKRLDEALASYDCAIALKPDFADAFHNRGVELFGLKRLDEALASYDQAITLRPDFSSAFQNRGNVLKELKRLDEALASYDQAIALGPDSASAFQNRGNVLKDLKRLGDALASYDQAIILKPDFAEAFHNRGHALIDCDRPIEALASYERALALKPDYEFLWGAKLNTQMSFCDWRGLPDQLHALQSAIKEDRKVAVPFVVSVMTNEPEIQLQASKINVRANCPEARLLGDLKPRYSPGKIRIGYYSADFHNHATSYLMAELFEAHDPELFSLYAFSFGPNVNDAMRQRVSLAFDHFFDVANKSDQEIAQLSRELGIDIAVDLKGFTQNSRTGIFAQRCAPIQVNYLGYPGTMGAPYMDYIVADKTVIPEGNQIYFSEKVAYLPHSYQVNDSKRQIADQTFTRQQAGLPETGFVFCCFNNNYKILPATFDGWMRCLQTVHGSVLWLLEDNPTAAHNLRQQAQARGVDPARLVFAQRMALAEHLARHRLADLFIDTFPCNAHTTASDALWAGLPVLTLMGKSFASRVAGSLLLAIDLPELITHTQEQYEEKAIELATRPELLQHTKDKLHGNRLTSPLFNCQLFVRHLEAAYLAMYETYQSGKPPSPIHVQP